MKKRLRRRWALALLAGLSVSPALGTTYYVSPTGSDSNSGTSSTAPWGSVAKVDDTTFQPGDQILFQYGSTWDAALTASSSGTTNAPIVYGSYGNPTLGNATFSGSNPISSSAFTVVTGTTYSTTSTTPVNWIYDNHQFTHEAQDALTQAGSSNANDPTTDLNYVENTPESFYYNPTNDQLYVNPGSAISSHVITAATRQDTIYSNSQNNLIFENLNSTETAADNAGYGIRIQGSSNVQLLNATASLAGKHSVGVIDTTGFVGTNLVANGSAPDQGFGGASAFVAYSDANPARPNNQNNTSVWTNLNYNNANGAYPAFISHGDPGAISKINLNNVVSLNGYGTGILIESSGPDEITNIQGGHLDGGTLDVSTNNSIINGVTITGNIANNGAIVVEGTNTVVQNNLLNGVQPYLYAGLYGAIEDYGINNTIRFNVANMNSQGPGIAVMNANSSSNIYGNIIQFVLTSPATVGIGQFFNGSGTMTSNYNVFQVNPIFFLNPNYQYLTLQQWQALGFDTNSIDANPQFTNPTTGDFSLQSSSPALGLYPGGLNPSLTTANSMIGSPYSNGNYSAGLNNLIPTTLNMLSTSIVLNNGQTATVSPIGNTLAIQRIGALFVQSSSTVDITGNVTNSGTFYVAGTLIQTGNFTNNNAALFTGPQIWTPGTVYTNAAGATTFQTDTGGSIAPTACLSVVATGGVINFASTQHLLGLNVASGALVQVTSTGTTRSVIFTPSLSITGTLDLAGNDLVIQGGSLQAITALIQQGYSGGRWNGSGITSSKAASDTTHLTALGVILNTTLYGSSGTLGLFDGTNPDINDVLVRYTYYGDANLDGKVDGSDYSRIDNGYVGHLTGWYNGDFNYDGVVNGSDYTLIDNAFNNQGAHLTSLVDANVISEIASVPEPTTLLILALLPGALSLRLKTKSLTKII